MATKEEQIQELLMIREHNIRQARTNLWAYNVLVSPDFYKSDRWHLYMLSEVLQKLYERKLTKDWFWEFCHSQFVPGWYADTVDWDRLEGDGKVYTSLIINMPPRHGKSRSLVNFCDWIFGKSLENRVITVSYNTDLAASMSRYVRDGIMKEKIDPIDIVYSDIFPKTKIAKGNAGFMKWALEGSFFNYLGTGLEGTITGVGGNVTIIDDPIKNASEAYNDRVLDDIWAWYTGTFMSRSEQEGKGSIDIINHTRWSTKDLCGRILTAPDMKNDWFVLSLPVAYEDHILCPEILPADKMKKLRDNMDTNIFNANYLQKPMDIEGRLFDNLKTYSELPSGTEKCIAYCDTADEGDDYLACVMGVIKEGEGFITDIYFTQDPMQITEPETAKRLYENKVNHAKIESNNGGKGFARNVDKIIWEKYHTKQVNITWFHQTENKMARILTGSTFVMNHIYFPENWDKKWPDAYTAIMSFQKTGKNKHDDIVESIVEWGKMISGDGTINSFIEMMKDMKEGKGNR
jgi:predicted phage terminase large subunit-like protein